MAAKTTPPDNSLSSCLAHDSDQEKYALRLESIAVCRLSLPVATVSGKEEHIRTSYTAGFSDCANWEHIRQSRTCCKMITSGSSCFSAMAAASMLLVSMAFEGRLLAPCKFQVVTRRVSAEEAVRKSNSEKNGIEMRFLI